jgi:putative transposase
VNHPVATLCRVLGVSPSGYWAWHSRQPSPRMRADTELSQRITAIHKRSRGTYGSPRVHAQLRAEGVRCGRKRVARLMRLAGLEGCHRRRFVVTTRPKATATPAPDLVNRVFQTEAPDRLYVADITYIDTDEGFLYLGAVEDAFSRVVGWSMAEHLRTELVLRALDMAIWNRQPDPGVIHHSDHGSQYTSIAFGKRCRQAGVVPSMGTVGDCFDNAMAESFFASLECELLDRCHFTTRDEARLAVFDYIEVFYNRERLHSSLGYLSPAEFERRFQEALAA